MKAGQKRVKAGAGESKIPVVMQVVPELGPGGVEQGCIDMAIEIVRAKARAIVVSHGGSRVPELLRAGAVHIDLPVHSKNPFTIWRNIRRLRALVRKYDVDIVHARSRAPAWSALYACRGTQARFVTTCHAPYNIGGRLKRWYNSSIAAGERVIAISHFVGDYLKKNYCMDPEKIRVIPRGVALDRFHPSAVSPERIISLARKWRLPDGVSVVMMPARLTRWKGHHVLIDAMSLIKRPDVFCVLIGSDQGRTEYTKALLDHIRARKLEGHVRIVDHCDDMPAAYMLAAAVVNASIEPEGFGRVPVESQAMGRPTIATDHGGACETVIPGQTGWLVPPGDAKALAAAILQALDLEPERRALLATHAMAHVAENFTRTLMADWTLDVYAELLEGKYATTASETSAPGEPDSAILESDAMKVAAE